MNQGARVLYLSYDGLTDNLGQSQVLPYLTGLAAKGHRITLLTCEKPDALAARGEAVRGACEVAGIDWRPLRYRKRPPVLSTLVDLRDMARVADRLAASGGYDIVHCRSYLPALIGLRLQRRRGLKFLFDMRGFWIDERLERGIWPRGNPLYSVIASFLRSRERRFFQRADAVVTLTRAALPRIEATGGPGTAAKTEVIPCCVDLDLFDPAGGTVRAEGRARLGLGREQRVLAYVGSVGGAYPLEPLFDFFRAWAGEDQDARLLFVTHSDRATIEAHPSAQGLSRQLEVVSASRNEVPALLAAADLGASFILPSPAAVASSPTKLGEMLAMGLPVVANANVGDTQEILAAKGTGAVMRDFSTSEIARAAEALRAPRVSSAPRGVAKQWFSLAQGVETYDRIYRRLLAR